MHTKESIQALLTRSNKAVIRALVVVYQNQTQDERDFAVTAHQNGMGFNKIDSKFGSNLAEQVLNGQMLSARQVYCARKMMLKYWQQLINAAHMKAHSQVHAQLPVGIIQGEFV